MYLKYCCVLVLKARQDDLHYHRDCFIMIIQVSNAELCTFHFSNLTISFSLVDVFSLPGYLTALYLINSYHYIMTIYPGGSLQSPTHHALCHWSLFVRNKIYLHEYFVLAFSLCSLVCILAVPAINCLVALSRLLAWQVLQIQFETFCKPLTAHAYVCVCVCVRARIFVCAYMCACLHLCAHARACVCVCYRTKGTVQQ